MALFADVSVRNSGVAQANLSTDIKEVFGSHFELPDLGPIGANGLAHPRDFETPLASFDLDETPWTIVHKLTGELYHYKQNHTPFDVVSWHRQYPSLSNKSKLTDI
jgi:homogentisate 1,2-dioxygenase